MALDLGLEGVHLLARVVGNFLHWRHALVADDVEGFCRGALPQLHGLVMRVRVTWREVEDGNGWGLAMWVRVRSDRGRGW